MMIRFYRDVYTRRQIHRFSDAIPLSHTNGEIFSWLFNWYVDSVLTSDAQYHQINTKTDLVQIARFIAISKESNGN